MHGPLGTNSEMVKEPKTHKSFSWALYFKCFHKYMFFSCLSIVCTNIWLEVYFGIKKLEIVKTKEHIKMNIYPQFYFHIRQFIRWQHDIHLTN